MGTLGEATGATARGGNGEADRDGREPGLDPLRPGPDLLVRFARTQYEYRRLLLAAKTGSLRATLAIKRRGWFTTANDVEEYRCAWDRESAAPRQQRLVRSAT
jgi:hypothetical protein